MNKIETVSKYILIVLLPLIFSNILHMIVVKRNFFNSLAIPLSAHLFGNNKTWRGILFIPIVNMYFLLMINFWFHLQLINSALLGFFLGLSYIVFELPNSYLKRKLGILEGEQHVKYSFVFSLFDKMDSAFGVAFVYFLFGFVDLKFALLLFLINSLTHIIFSKLLVVLRIKKSF